MFKVCLDDFSGTNVENIALLLEGCGRFLLRSEETAERFGTMASISLVTRLLASFLRLLAGTYAAQAKHATFRSASSAVVGKCLLSS